MEAERAFVSRLAARIRTDELDGTRWWRRIHELRATGVSMEEIFRDPVAHLGEEAAHLAPLLQPPT